MPELKKKCNGSFKSENAEKKDYLMRLLLLVAAGLLAVAMVWSILLNNNSFSKRIGIQLREHGINTAMDDFIQQSYEKNTSIRKMMAGVDISAIIAVSEVIGLSADVDKVGEVYLLLADVGDNRVLSVFIVDETVELAFVQKLGEDSVLPANYSDE